MPASCTVFWLRVLLFAVCIALVFYGMYIPVSTPLVAGVNDKALHVMALIAVSVSSRLVFYRSPSVRFWIALFVIAAGMELLQPWVQPTRQFALLDMLANVFGAVLGMVVCYCLSVSGGQD